MNYLKPCLQIVVLSTALSLAFAQTGSIESFESERFPPVGWTKISNPGAPYGWIPIGVGDTVPGFPKPRVSVAAPDGGGDVVAMVAFWTGDVDGSLSTGNANDQWLITPQISNVQPGDSLKFQLKYFGYVFPSNGQSFVDSLDILISTAGRDTTADFIITVDSLAFATASSREWQPYAYALSDFVAPGSDIYVAFREHIGNTITEGDVLFLDLVELPGLVTGIADLPELPAQFRLRQNFPNPFNPTTNISFSLPQRSGVTLQVFNILGQRVAILLDDVSLPAGEHNLQFDGADLLSGVYYYRLEAASFSDTKRMILIK